ncbi:hypothetical protein GCM10010420_48890 [Streptomyces glaucosporus]|uniref:Gram-positive cocci surface proteins LPxTG domain-containing protein n=1 Tax=Streptomyces glaucosporus TaxID=284044 RepID=A0ABN3IVF8_9ACTN
MRGLAAAAAIGLAAAAAGPVPAASADEPTRAWAVIDAPDRIALPVPSAGGGPVAPHAGYGFYDGGETFPAPENVRFVIDATGLEGVATIAANHESCTAEGAVVTCVDDGSLHAPWEPFTLTAVPGAGLGAKGTLTYEVTADRATGDTASSEVVVGAPELVVGTLPDRKGLKPGDTVELPLTVRNTGTLPTERIDLRLRGVPGLTFTSRPENCRFMPDDSYDGPGVHCAVEHELAPGGTAVLDEPLEVRVTEKALATWIDYSATAVPAGSPGDPNGTPGTGAPLGMEPAGGGDFEDDGSGTVELLADNHADFAARGGGITRAKGDPGSGTVSFGVVNNGPAAAYRRDRKPLLYVDVTLPEGVTAVGNPVDEEPDEDASGECLVYGDGDGTGRFEPGHRRYLCPQAPTEEPGRGQTYTLEVRIAEGAEKAGNEGTVRLVPGPEGFSADDPDAANDTARITFARTPGEGPEPSPSPSEPAGGADGGKDGNGGPEGGSGSSGGNGAEGPGGSLASTGTSGTVTAAAAAALLAAGGAAVLLAVRRRS